MQEQKGKHSSIPQRASLQPAVRTPTTNRPAPDDLEEDDFYSPVRTPRSAIRYTTTHDHVIQSGNKRIIIHQGVPPARQQPSKQQGKPEPAAKSRSHWLLFVGIAMLLMLIGWILVTLLLQWWQVTQDDWRFGRPRTYQVDQRVGHNDATIPSHFIAMDVNHRAQIIECPASDCSKAVIYLGAQIIGDGGDLAVVTLTFKDVNGDGKPDMLVHVADQTYVFINENGRFRPARPDEHFSL